MAKVKTLILRAPGTNCDMETAFAFEQAGSQVDVVHINALLRREEQLSDYQIMVIPGGFTYGDDISGGKILANELKPTLADEMLKFIEDGRLILGICNGLQVLAKAGIVPGPSIPLTLSANDSSRFECRWVHLRVNEKSPCIFTKDISMMYLPVAHGEGKIVAEPDDINIALQYCDEKGDIDAGYPYNPNGSVANIAGICDPTGRIFALMPHPERFLRWTQHPRWTREAHRPSGDGLHIFQNAVQWIQKI